MPAGENDFALLDLARAMARQVRRVVASLDTTAARGVARGRGEGGDVSLAVDALAEAAAIDVLEEAAVAATVVSEERGEVAVAGGGELRVVIDPVDGSLNAKRGLPFASLSVAFAQGSRLRDVTCGFVCDLASGDEWFAVRGRGAYRRLAGPDASASDDRLPLERALPASRQLEVLALECTAPRLVAAHAAAIEASGAERVRVLGGVAEAMCLVAEGRVDALVALRPLRVVDFAAARVVVEEAGGSVWLGGEGGKARLAIAPRLELVAARDAGTAERLAELFFGAERTGARR